MKIRRATLQGLETEFGFSAVDHSGHRCDHQAQAAIFEIIESRIPAISSGGNGYFLANGGLLYVDTGDHLEWSTPECTSPKDVVKYQRAAERLLASAVAELEASGKFAKIRIFKGNVCYTSPLVTWGSHESYLYRNFGARLPRELIPFLVSRVVFSGAGGLCSRSSGAKFLLSPRVAHLRKEVSGCTTGDRAIFNTKNESLSAEGYGRMHLICGDSNCSQFQTWLRLGSTMLVVAMVDAGLAPGESVQLANALAAMRCFAADHECSAPTVDPMHPAGITALEIQRCYLAMAERYAGTSLMPDWADEVCVAWRETLDALATDPSGLADRLDWPLKYALMKQRVEQHSIGSLECVELWSSVLDDVDAQIGQSEKLKAFPVSHELIKREGRRRNPLGQAIRSGTKRLAERGYSWRRLDEFMSLRWELCELDTAFGDISDDGIFAAMDRSGALGHRLWDEEACEAGILEPPGAGRARIRGNEIKRLARDRDARRNCAWSAMWDSKECLNLSDPFAAEARWKSRKRGDRREITDLLLPSFLSR